MIHPFHDHADSKVPSDANNDIMVRLSIEAYIHDSNSIPEWNQRLYVTDIKARMIKTLELGFVVHFLSLEIYEPSFHLNLIITSIFEELLDKMI